MLGEHTDWAAGYRDRNRDIPPGFTLVATTQEGLHARVSGRRDGRLVFRACTPSHTVSGNHTAVAPLDIPMTMQVSETSVPKFTWCSRPNVTPCNRQAQLALTHPMYTLGLQEQYDCCLQLGYRLTSPAHAMCIYNIVMHGCEAAPKIELFVDDMNDAEELFAVDHQTMSTYSNGLISSTLNVANLHSWILSSPTCQALEDVIADGGFYMYAAGTVLVTCSKFGLLSPDPTSGASSMDISGLTVDNHLTTLPLKKGLSSSAAVCVLVVRALCLVYGLDLTVPEVKWTGARNFQIIVCTSTRGKGLSSDADIDGDHSLVG